MFNNKKKTVFLTIERGLVARNLLRNSFFQKLKQEFNLVIITPAIDDPQFKELTKDKSVILESFVKHKLSKFEQFFTGIHKALIYNPTVAIKARYGFSAKQRQEWNWKKKIVFYTQSIFFRVLSKIKILRDFWKWLDCKIFFVDYYKDLFEKYHPDLVFISNISSDEETYLLWSARKNKIKTIGMTKSWDNFSKIGMRAKLTELIVWNDFMKFEAQEFQNYQESKIKVVGIPQFDIYHDIKNKYTREDFTKIYNLNLEKKIIVFGQASPLLSPDDPFVISLVKDWIIKNNLPWQVLIRPHIAHPMAIEVFKEIVDNRVVFIDNKYNPSTFSDSWDLSFEHHLRLALTMRFSDLVLGSVSTLVLDAMGSDNNVLCYRFNKSNHVEFGDSIARLYETLWFKDLQKYGLDNYIVDSPEQLFKELQEILTDGKKDRLYYSEILKRFCYQIDGLSGERLFEVVKKYI